MPAGRIGKQVQDLRGTAAVMAEFRFAQCHCAFGMGRLNRNEDARAGRPALLFEYRLYGRAEPSAVGGGTRAADGRNVCAVKPWYTVFWRALFLCGSFLLSGRKGPLFFCGACSVLPHKERYSMKQQHHLRTGVLAMTLALLTAGCAPATGTSAPSPAPATAETAADGHYPVTVTNYNYLGDEVSYTYEEAPQRVVAVYQGSIETMIALGLEDHVIASYGLDNEVKPEWQEGFAAMNYREDVFAPDKETMTLLEPDMILSWGSLFSEKNLGDVTGWNSKGVATYINTNTRGGGRPRTLENEYTDILNLGRIFDVEDRAEALVEEMRTAITTTLTAVEGQDSPRVAVVEPIGGGMTNYGADSLAGDMVVQLGGTLVKPEGGEMSKEELVQANPDVIFVIYMAYSGDDPETVVAEQLGAITRDPALASLSAVAADRVKPVMLGDVYAAGPRTVDGIRTIAAGMYPDMSVS